MRNNSPPTFNNLPPRFLPSQPLSCAHPSFFSPLTVGACGIRWHVKEVIQLRLRPPPCRNETRYAEVILLLKSAALEGWSFKHLVLIPTRSWRACMIIWPRLFFLVQVVPESEFPLSEVLQPVYSRLPQHRAGPVCSTDLSRTNVRL